MALVAPEVYCQVGNNSEFICYGHHDSGLPTAKAIANSENVSPPVIQEVVIFDLQGRMLLKENVGSSTHLVELNLSELETGLYIVVVFTPDGMVVNNYFFKQ